MPYGSFLATTTGGARLAGSTGLACTLLGRGGFLRFRLRFAGRRPLLLTVPFLQFPVHLVLVFNDVLAITTGNYLAVLELLVLATVGEFLGGAGFTNDEHQGFACLDLTRLAEAGEGLVSGLARAVAGEGVGGVQFGEDEDEVAVLVGHLGERKERNRK